MNVHEELRTCLAEYMKIEERLKVLNDEREALRTKMRGLLMESRVSGCNVLLEKTLLNVRLTHNTTITYDEPLLRERLKENYPKILKPDIKKIRSHMAEIEPLLKPLLETIGSPSRTRIKEKIESGELRMEDFKNAFQKTEKSTLYVRKMQHQEDPFF